MWNTKGEYRNLKYSILRGQIHLLKYSEYAGSIIPILLPSSLI